MYRKLFIGAMFVVGVPMLSLADGPDIVGREAPDAEQRLSRWDGSG